MRSKLLFITLIITCFKSSTITGQIVSSPVKYSFYEYFSNVEDSILKRIGTKNSISLQIPQYRSLHIYKDSMGWKGYCIFTNQSNELTPLMAINTESGVIYEEKFYRTTLYEFGADSLYKLIVTQGVLNIKQLTQDSIEMLYTKRVAKKKGIVYRFGESSHENYVIVTINGMQSKKATYAQSLIQRKELQFIKTLKACNFLLQKIDEIANTIYY